MKKTLLIICSFLVVSLQAQLSYAPDVISVEGDINSSGIIADFEVTNTTDQTIRAYWAIDRSSVPAEWQFSICDQITCFAYDVEASPANKVNEFSPNEVFSNYSVHVRPNGVEGVHTILVIFSASTGSNEVYVEVPITISASLMSSVADIKVEDITLYPNPTSDYFQIRNDDNIERVSLYSILGKKIFDLKHEIDKSYYISELNKGIYMVRMFNKQGDVIKVVRLSKR